jgi:hypothetical protein
MKTKTYPEIGFLRLRDVIGGEDNPGIIPVSRSSRTEGIAEGWTGLIIDAFWNRLAIYHRLNAS